MPLDREHITRALHVPLVFYTNPFELVLGAALAINGVAGLCGRPSPSLADLPTIPLHAYLAISTIGGVMLMVALAKRDDTRAIEGAGRALERSALFLVATGYLGLGAVILVNNSPRGIPIATVSILVGLACLLRARAIRKATLVILAKLSEGRR